MNILVYYVTKAPVQNMNRGDIMEFKENLPIYIQIINYIKKDMVVGAIEPGQKLPSTRELSKSLKVNPNTIQRAYRELEGQGLVYTRRGSGTFATEDEEMVKNLKKDIAKDLVGNFLKEMRSLNFNKVNIKEMIDNYIEED